MFETLVIIFYFAVLLFPIAGILIGLKYFNPFDEEPRGKSAVDDAAKQP